MDSQNIPIKYKIGIKEDISTDVLIIVMPTSHGARQQGGNYEELSRRWSHTKTYFTVHIRAKNPEQVEVVKRYHPQIGKDPIHDAQTSAPDKVTWKRAQ